MSELSDYRKYVSDPHIKRLEDTIHNQALRIRALERLVGYVDAMTSSIEIKALIASSMADLGEPAPVFEAPGKEAFR